LKHLHQNLFTATLANGITVLGEEMPGVESVAVALHVAAGGIHDPPGRCGLATLAGEMSLRGAGGRTSREIVDTLDGAGAVWSHGVTTTHTTVAAAMVPRQLPEVLSVFADLLRRPDLPADQFEAAQQMVLQTIAGMEDDPAHRAIAALKRLHLPSPWGQPTEGIAEDVESATLDDVESFLSRRMGPTGMIVAIAGRIEWNEVLRQFETLLGNWQGESAVTIPTGPRGPFSRHIEHDSQQTHIALAWSMPPARDDDSAKCRAVLSVLGGGTSSRFFTEVREKRGLCYGVSAGYASQRDFGLAICHAGTTAARAQETLNVMLAEIDRLPGSLDADELERVKARVTAGLVMQQESTTTRADSLAGQWYHLGRLRTLQEDLARYDALDVPTLEAWLASRPPRDLSVVSLGPEPLEVPHAVSA
jgi:predicted Zn-dependent peptidase